MPGYGFGPARRRRTGASALADYGWAVDFRSGQYRHGAQLTGDVTALTGYSFARASSVSEQGPGGTVQSFASGVPAILPGLGYVQRPTLTNLLLNAGQASALATQDVSLTSGTAYTLSFIGAGSVAIGGAATGSLAGTGANDRVRLTVTAGSTGAATFATTGDVRYAGLVAAVTPGPIIPTAGTAATAPNGDLSFAPPDLSGDWLALVDLDFLETIGGLGAEETIFSISGATSQNRLGLSRNNGNGRILLRYVIANGSLMTAGMTGSFQTSAGRCLLGLRKLGDAYTLAAIPAGSGYAAQAMGTLAGWSAPFTRCDIGKGLGAVINAQAAMRFAGIRLGSVTDPQMQASLEALS